ncbi:MAG: divalent-cation tolerance protein CutA [Asticcacaulis sp.]|nr:divalent-cation tolerance protein CutA [Asticcacaulis sp.]
MTDLITVSIACANAVEADTIGHLLVERRLAACVQSHAIRSTYHWQGAVETADEVMLTAKTLGDRFDALAEAVGEVHSYEVPEIVAQPIIRVAPAYELWLRAALAGA